MARWFAYAGTVAAGALSWGLLLPPAPVTQPLSFNHARHQAVACAVCHSGAETSARAGIPRGDACLKCHATAPAVAGAAVLWPEIARGRRIEWLRVMRLPDHVMFSHRRHVTLGRLECASCHGDVGTSSRPPQRPARRLQMTNCISCHRQLSVSEDCAACHR